MEKQSSSSVLALIVLVLCIGGVVTLGMMTKNQSFATADSAGGSEVPLVNRPVHVTPAPELNTPMNTTSADRVATNVRNTNEARATDDTNDSDNTEPTTTTGRIGAAIAEADASEIATLLAELPAEAIDNPFTAPDFGFDGLTPLTIVASYSDYDGVMKVLDRGADPDATNIDTTTALMHAVQHIGSTRAGVVKALLEAGPTVDERSENGDTALMLAAKMGNTLAIGDMLEADADPNATNANGKTALMLASEHSPFDCVLLLLNGGANVEIEDYNGKTASDLAMQRGGDAGPMIVTLLDEATGG